MGKYLKKTQEEIENWRHKEKITELDNNFDKLILTNKLNINSIEDIAMKNIEDYKQIINTHIEDLIFNKINEKELIGKKNENGKN